MVDIINPLDARPHRSVWHCYGRVQMYRKPGTGNWWDPHGWSKALSCIKLKYGGKNTRQKWKYKTFQNVVTPVQFVWPVAACLSFSLKCVCEVAYILTHAAQHSNRDLWKIKGGLNLLTFGHSALCDNLNVVEGLYSRHFNARTVRKANVKLAQRWYISTQTPAIKRTVLIKIMTFFFFFFFVWFDVIFFLGGANQNDTSVYVFSFLLIRAFTYQSIIPIGTILSRPWPSLWWNVELLRS